MTRDEIIRIAREQGLPETATEGLFIVNSDDLGRMLAAEREACAKVCENERERLYEWGYGLQVITADRLAVAIRARGDQ